MTAYQQAIRERQHHQPHLQAIPKAVHRMRNEHDVLVPGHQLALPCGAPHNEPLHPMLQLHVHKVVVRLQIKAAVRQVGGLDGGDQAELLDLLNWRAAGGWCCQC